MNQWRFRIPLEEEQQTSARRYVARAWREATNEQIRALFERGAVRADSVIVTRPDRTLMPQSTVEFTVDEQGAETFGLPDVETLLWADEWVIVDKPVGIPGRIRSDDPTEPIRFMADLLGIERDTVQPVWEMPTAAGGPWLLARSAEVADRLADEICSGPIKTTWSALTERPEHAQGSWESELGTLQFAVTRTEEGLAELQLTPTWKSGDDGCGNRHVRQILTMAAEAGFPVLGDARNGGFLVSGGLRLRLSAIYGTDDFAHSWPVPRDWWPEEPVVVPVEEVEEEEEAERRIDEEAVEEVAIRLDEAIGRRRKFFREMGSTDVFRVVHGAADGLSGLVIDRIGPLWRVIATTGEARAQRDAVFAMIEERDPAAMIITLDEPEGVGSSDSRAQARVVRRGAAVIDPGDDLIVREEGLRFVAHPWERAEVGLRADERDVRRSAVERASTGEHWLQLNCHTGAFSVALARAGVKTTNIDPTGRFKDWIDANFQLNGFDLALREYEHIDIGEFFDAEERRFDGIIVDLPPFESVEVDPIVEPCFELLKPDGSMLVYRRNIFLHESIEEVVERIVAGADREFENFDAAPLPGDFPAIEKNNKQKNLLGIWLSG